MFKINIMFKGLPYILKDVLFLPLRCSEIKMSVYVSVYVLICMAKSEAM